MGFLSDSVNTGQNNSVNPDQAPNLIWVCTICRDNFGMIVAKFLKGARRKKNFIKMCLLKATLLKILIWV